MATEKGEGAPGRPPIPGDLPYREPPVIEGKAEEVHETTLEPAESAADTPAGEPSGGSMDELKAAVEDALESREATTPPPQASEPAPIAPVIVAKAPEPVAVPAPPPVQQVVQPLPPAAAPPAVEMSLGSSLIASGMLRKPVTAANDPLAPIRRMSQAEKIAFFS